MSIDVVTKASIFGDDTAEVPSWDDFKNLKSKTSSIEKSLSGRVTETVFNSEVAALKKKIEAAKESVTDLRESIVHTLENGEWKDVFCGEIEAALRRLETRYDELNAALDEKMQTLPRLDMIEENIKSIFIQQSEKIKKIIVTEGEDARQKLQQQMEQNDWLTTLTKEATEITWEEK